MKKYILKRERVFHLLSLMAVAASIFTNDFLTKMGLVVLGVFGLFVVALAKGNKSTILIYLVLLVVALGVGLYLGTQRGLIPGKL